MQAQSEDFKSHVLQAFNAELENLMNHILELGGLVEKQLDLAVQAMQTGDVDQAKEVRNLDRLINETERMSDMAAIKIIARHQPTASDLRLIISSLRIGIDLERVGDEVVKLARLVERFERYQQTCVRLQAYPHFFKLVEMARDMLKKALDAYARLDLAAAVSLLKDEEDADVLYKEVVDAAIQGFNEGDAADVSCFLEFIAAIRAVERMTDHLANVAESIIYIINGRDVRSAESEQVTKMLKQDLQQADENG